MNQKGDNVVKTKDMGVKGFQVLEDECIWMKAGVVNFRTCDNAYDCYNCLFDRGMRKTMSLESSLESKTEQPAWVAYLKKNYHGASRPCRQALTGRIDAPKICTMNYECYHCPYDQMLDEFDLIKEADAPIYKMASGYRLAQGYYYHMGHSWIKFEHGGRVRVGFDDFLVRLFGAMQSLSLPPLGARLEQDQVGWIFGKDDHRAAVLSPVTGTVLSINHKAQEYPEITNRDPYQKGWLFILEPDMPKKNLKRLYFGDEGIQWMEQEGRKLLGLVGPEYEHMAAAGGRAINDFYENYSEIGWDRLVSTFLRTERM
ncbi:glycine cleavage system protein H [Thermodesulfobacteriota bacterium]